MTQKNMAQKSLFERRLSASPRPFFLAAAALILDGQIASLAEIGLDAERIASVVDAMRGSDSDQADALDSLTSAISASRLPASDVQPYADALARRRALDPYGHFPADFFQSWDTEAALGGPAAQVWLSCAASKFSAQDAWTALANNPAAQEGAIAHPEILMDQAINAGELPCIGQGGRWSARQCEKLSARLLAALAERMATSEDPEDREAGARFACCSLEALSKHGQCEKAQVLARGAIKAFSMESTLDPAGELVGELAKFAMGNEEILTELASAASAIGILPVTHSGFGFGEKEHGFVFAPSGHGGLNFPKFLPGMKESFFSLAELALAFGDGPHPNSGSGSPGKNQELFSPELAALAAKMRELGLVEAIEASGTPKALRELVEIQRAIQAGDSEVGQGDAAMEAYAIMSQSSAPTSQKRTRLRV